MRGLRGLAAIAVTVLLLVGCAPVDGRDRPVTLEEELARVVRRWHERAWVPGVSVAVRHGDRWTWSGAAGVADERTAAPLRADAPFAVASVTKPFVAALVLDLAEEGLVDLDAAVTAYLPSSPAVRGVTVRHLLAMRSGITDYTQVDGFIDRLEDELRRRRARAWSPRDLVDLVRDVPPAFPPGTRFAYSNTNYVLLGQVVRAVTGRPWWEELDARLLDPLGLEGTVYPRDGLSPAVVAGHADLDRDADRDSLAGLPYQGVVTAADAAGGLVSTAGELATFVRGLWSAGVLSPATTAAMTDVGRVGYERQYGLGVFVHRPDLRTRVVGHTGGGIGYASALWYAPEHDLAIAVLVNDSAGEPEDLAELLLRRFLARADGT